MYPKTVLRQQIETSIDYTRILVDLLNEELIDFRPSDTSRTYGEILFHLIRSMEYYTTGVLTKKFEALPYTPDRYPGIEGVTELFVEVSTKVLEMVNKIDRDELHDQYGVPEAPIFGLNLMIEMLYHQSHHIGQLQVYLRLQGIEVPEFEFLV